MKRLRTRGFRALRPFLLVVLGVLAVTIVSVVALWSSVYAVRIHRLTRSLGDTVFYSADGKPWFRLDERRRDVRLQDISLDLRNAVVATEDQRFYTHPGVDPIAILRAAVHNLRGGSYVEGGSTITQQLARTLFLTNRRTYGRKLKEAGLAMMLEAQFSKEAILELYLNHIWLTGAVHGVEPMSEQLFGKSAGDLTLSEAALLAGLIRAPSALSPWTNLAGALRRRRQVLERMRVEGFITPEAERAAAEAVPSIQPPPRHADAVAGYAKGFLRQQFRLAFGSENPPSWQVHTSFLPNVQAAAERAVTDGLRRLGRPGLQAALVAIEPQTGDILALVGGHDVRLSPFDRATGSHRQPGSAFKPFVFAAALERGFSPVSVLSNLARSPGANPDEWLPRNANDELPDTLTLRAALFTSNNRAAAVLQQEVGSAAVLQTAGALGLRNQPDVPSLALGTGLVTPLELAAAYAAFPNGGFAVTPRAMLRVLDRNGSVELESHVQRQRVLSAHSAFQMVTMLEDVIDRGTGSAARSLGVRFPAGGKTGTSDDYKDAWFVGFSSSLVASVWVGFDQPSTVAPGAYGARYALPIWSAFMGEAARRVTPHPFEAPPGLRREPLCSVTFLRPADTCPTYTEHFKPGDDVPVRICPMHSSPYRRVDRAIGRFFAGLGRRLKGWFKW